jgi:hypothetical protein
VVSQDSVLGSRPDFEKVLGNLGRYGGTCIKVDLEGHGFSFFHFPETLESAVHADHAVHDSFL